MDDETRPIDTPAAATPAATPEPSPAATSEPALATAATGGSPGRWLVAGGVAVVAVAVIIGALLLFGRPTTSTALQYIPGDAAIVGEIRMDLPGDQLQHVGNLLAHFPGFADQSTLSTKMDEAMKRLLATDGQTGLDYVNDVKPWLSGPGYFALMAPAGGTAVATGGHGVFSATTSGTASCEPVFRGQTTTHETYRGLDLTESSAGTLACVLDGRQGLIGDTATVHLALDAKAAGSGIDKNAKYAAARTALGLDRLATLYISGDALSRLLPSASATPGSADLTAVTGPIPDWTMMGVRAEDESLVVDSVTAPVVQPASGPSLLPLPATHPSVFAPMVPADTLVFAESQGAGVALQNLLSRLHALPELATAFQTLDGMGGPAQLVGWIDDAGVAVSMHGTTPYAALLIEATDEAGASSRVAALGGLLVIAGGNGIQVTHSTIAGVAVTNVTITDLRAFVPPGSVPGLTIPSTGPISFSIAAHGKVIIVTSGEAAMTAILNVAAGSSLADDATFRLAGQRGLANSRTTVYVAAGAAIKLVQQVLPADQLATFTSNYLPYVAPLQAVSITATDDANANRSRLVIGVTKPATPSTPQATQ
ncbi:MAG TPA: DUF3352 domain-containing protein [Candidatus Dormibacteraeota bacterium]|nr:DUF3352 domain-containing protein [Candidatus Dormibacteraeota bacterium]